MRQIDAPPHVGQHVTAPPLTCHFILGLLFVPCLTDLNMPYRIQYDVEWDTRFVHGIHVSWSQTGSIEVLINLRNGRAGISAYKDSVA